MFGTTPGVWRVSPPLTAPEPTPWVGNVKPFLVPNAEMLRTKNFGRKSLNEIKEILSNLGLTFGMKFDSQGRLVSPSGQPVAPSGDEIEEEDEEEVNATE